MDDSCQNILLKVRNNLVDIGQHVSEARREDDSSSKHGETREKSHHGRRLWTKSSGRNIFFCTKVLLALLFHAFKIFQYRKYLKPFFCVEDLLTFDLAQPTPPNTKERENADLGEGRGF